MPKLGWMAGVIDMKGRIVFKNNKTRVTPQVTLYVESKDLSIIRALSEMTGTRPELKAPTEMPTMFIRHNCAEHCPEAHTHVNPMMPQVARWTISGAALVVVLYNLMPFLVTDRGWQETNDQIVNMTVSSGRGFKAVSTSLRRLEALGWDLPLLFAAALIGDGEEMKEIVA
jgi:hypothetical protein